eukprot:TRINITY_DN671_c0_g1_i1.p1 TRINITY_DN671_c0_g1~~TRINITY_DN671_c0_g1_i1.p1  ORF type:complete len:162 (+),score=26.20 TRINITY_DN671_c0_g1_i1:470-955(+)
MGQFLLMLLIFVFALLPLWPDSNAKPPCLGDKRLKEVAVSHWQDFGQSMCLDNDGNYKHQLRGLGLKDVMIATDMIDSIQSRIVGNLQEIPGVRITNCSIPELRGLKESLHHQIDICTTLAKLKEEFKSAEEHYQECLQTPQVTQKISLFTYFRSFCNKII